MNRLKKIVPLAVVLAVLIGAPAAGARYKNGHTHHSAAAIGARYKNGHGK